METITVEELLKLPSKNIIDIRDIDRYHEGNIPGSTNIPMDDLTRDPSRYLDKNKTYYMCCEFGYKTKRVGKVLNSLGYHIINIKDGYYAYEMLKK